MKRVLYVLLGFSLALGAQQNQDIPFEQVVELIRPERSLAHSPLFQVMFDWQNESEETFQLPGLTLSDLPEEAYTTSKFELTLSLQEVEGRIEGGFEYAAALFEGATIKRYLGCLEVLLKAMVADDAQTVDRLPMLSEEERRQVLYE